MLPNANQLRYDSPHGTWWGCALLFILCVGVFGDQFFAVSWDSDDGLPHNAVYRIVQTPDGYLWLATSAGLARFDGLNFLRINSPQLRNRQSESIRNLVIDSDGCVLVAPASGGIFAVEPSGVVRTNELSRALDGERVASLYTAKDGTLWISLIGGILCSWKDGEFSKIGRMHTSGSGRVTMAEDSYGDLWLAVGDFVGIWKEGVFQRRQVSPRPSFGLASGREGIWLSGADGVVLLREGREEALIRWSSEMSQVTTIFEQGDGLLWAGTTDTGLFRLEEGRFVRGPATHPEIGCLAADDQGNLWAGSVGGGVYSIRRNFVKFFDSRMGLPQDVSFSICEGQDSSVWFANRSGGLVRWHKGAMMQLPQTTIGMPGAVVVVVAGAVVYMGTDVGLFLLREASEKPIEVEAFRGRGIRCLFVSRAGQVWVASRTRFGRIRGVEFNQSTLDKLEDGFVSAIAEDSTGRILAGTSNGELFREAGEGFEKLSGLPEGLHIVNAVAPHPDGSVWLGLSGGGIVRWKNAAAHSFTEGYGPPDNAVTQLLWENSTNLWGGSRAGIWRVSLAELARAEEQKERVYPLILGRSDGAPGGSCMGSHQPVSFKSRDGSLWFATRRGVVRVEPSRFQSSTRKIPVLLEEFKIDGKPLAINLLQRVPATSREYGFRYNALLLTSAEQLRFRYRLDGFDADWVDAGAQRQAKYTRLPPGTYRFLVQVRDPRGGWQENMPMLAFEVVPAWWQKPSVQALIGVAAAGLLALIIRSIVARRYREDLRLIEQRQAVEAERARIARDLHDDMGAELTQLSHLGHVAPADSPEHMRESLARVSERARELSAQMDAIVWTVNPKNDSLEQLAAYLSNFGQEMFRGSPTRLRVDRPHELPNLVILPELRHHILMVVKEALSNVAKHAQASEVWLRLRMEPRYVLLEVEDNGKGFDAVAGTGEGLGNMRSRVAELGGTFEKKTRAGGGTVIRFCVPLPT